MNKHRANRAAERFLEWSDTLYIRVTNLLRGRKRGRISRTGTIRFQNNTVVFSDWWLSGFGKGIGIEHVNGRVFLAGNDTGIVARDLRFEDSIVEGFETGFHIFP